MLAIVIPAYKAEYLKVALTSIAGQTDLRFRLYIGDDCSSENLQDICIEFSSSIPITYYRFDTNMGQKSLVSHWERCVRLTSEEWVWLFCDDDFMEKDCVHSFYQIVESTGNKFDLLRFNTKIINRLGCVVKINPLHPPYEEVAQFAYHRILRHRASFLSEYVFRRDIFEECGGIVEFPAAWCSDDATWISYGRHRGIFTIYGPCVRWRLSGVNISSDGDQYQCSRLSAVLLFLDWLRVNKVLEDIIEVSPEILERDCYNWLLHHANAVAPISLVNIWKMSNEIACRTERRNIAIAFKLVGITIKYYLDRIMSCINREASK